MLLHKFLFEEYRIEVHDSIKEDPTSLEWQKMPGLSPHLRSEMLTLIERSEPKDMEFRYLFVFKQDGPASPCGVIYFQVLSFDHTNFNFENKSGLQYLASIILRLKTFRIFLAGCIFAVDFAPCCIDSKRIDYRKLMEIISRYSRLEKFDIMILKDLPGNFSREIMSGFGFEPMLTDMTMQLEINPLWNSFKDYENALTHKYGQRVRKIRRQGIKLVRRKLSKEDLLEHKTRIDHLFLQVAERQTLRMGIVDSSYFEQLYDSLGKNFFINGYFLDEKLIAFASHIIHENKLEVHYIGIDYLYNLQYAIYFNILYDGIDLAFSHSKRSLELGRTAREAKAVVGCHPVYFNDYIKVPGFLARQMFSLLKGYFLGRIGENWKKRHPFKTFATSVGPK
jgi:hypothetical protein